MSGHQSSSIPNQNGRRRSFPRPASPQQHHHQRSGDNNRIYSSLDPSSAGGVGAHRVRFNSGSGEQDHERYGPLELVLDIVTAALAMVCIAGVSAILVVLYVTVRPFSSSAYRRLAAQFGAASFIDALALLLPNTKIYLTGDSDVPTPVGTSLMVCNHLVDGDWWAMFMLGRCVGLKGSIKVMLRNEYLHIDIPQGESSGTTSSSAAASSSGMRSSANASSLTNSPNGGTSTATSVSARTYAMASARQENGTSTNTNGIGSSTSTSGSTSGPNSGALSSTIAGGGIHHHHYPQDLSLLAKLLHRFLEFPLINGEDYISNRDQLFQLLRSFAQKDSNAPVQLLLFPEGWSRHNGANRRSILAKSNEFAQREGRPQLRHLLLPRARGFNASLECLRESNPVVYDFTMANSGYDGSLPPSIKLSTITLWNILRRKLPREIHIRIKRYSMEEVLQDSSWLDKVFAEKDRMLGHFARHQCFPVDSRGYCRYRVFNSRQFNLETSIASLLWLLILPSAVPFLLLLSVPLFWALFWLYLAQQAYRIVFPNEDDLMRSGNGDDSAPGSAEGTGEQTPGSNSAGTPYIPATPFASPSVTSWRDMLSQQQQQST